MLHQKRFGVALLALLATAGCERDTQGEKNPSREAADGRKTKPATAKTTTPQAPRLKEIALGAEHGCARRHDDVVVCWGKRTLVGHDEAPGQHPFQLAAPVPQLEKARAVVVRDARSCTIARDQTVQCWEDGFDVKHPQRVEGLRGVASLALGPRHACAVHLDGTVSCWGAGGEGQLGDRKTDHGFEEPLVKVEGLEDVTQLAVGRYHSCALKQDGTVHCWGGGDMKQLGNGQKKLSLVPIPVPGVNHITQITAYDETTCGRDEDGAVHCWGDGGLEDGRPKQVRGLPPVAEVQTGDDHTCARTIGGDLWCWGDASEGATGTGPARNDDEHAPMKVAAVSGVTAMALDDDGTCVIAKDGPRCWGRNDAGRFGDGTSVEQLVPVEVPKLNDAIALHLEDELSCALRKNGAVSCWGGRRGGNDFNTERNYVPRDLPAQIDAAGLGVSRGTVVAVSKEGTMARWKWYGARTDPARHVVGLSGIARWLDAGYFTELVQLRDGSLARIDVDYDGTGKMQPIQGLPAMKGVQHRVCHVSGPEMCEMICGVTPDAEVKCARLLFPTGTPFDETPAVAQPATPVEITDVVDVAVNFYGGWAVTKDGTVTEWEESDDGMTYAPVKGVTDAVSVTTAEHVAGGCAVTKQGTVSCWAEGMQARYGILGDGSIAARDEAAVVKGLTDAVSVAMSSQHVCALRRGGKVSCWGRNNRDQIGVAHPGVRYEPVHVRL